MSQACAYCFRPKSSRIRGRNNVLTSSFHFIERYALNGNGVVGSLYDARTDDLLSALPVNKHLLVSKVIKETPTCNLIKVDNSNRDNLLQMIDIQDDLRLSIALNMTPVTEGTSLLHTYGLPADRTVRIIDYYYVDQEEYLSDDIELARKTLPDSLPNNNATHIITSVKRGIDFVIVLEFPDSANLNEIDSVLEKLPEYFIKSEAAFLSIEEQKKINCLKPTIFTHITEIHSLPGYKNISDICQNIHQYIYQNKKNISLSYTLRPVKCIYYDDPCDNRIFHQSDQSIIHKIEQKLLPLSSRFKTIKYLFYDKVSPQLYQYLKTRIDEICGKIIQVKDMYTGVQRSLARIINDFRRGKWNLSLLDNELDGAEIKKLDSELATLQNELLKLQRKACFITKLKTDHQMEYINVANLEEPDDDQETLESKLFSFDQEQCRSYLCSSDELIEKNPYEYEKFCQQLIELRQTNSSLCLVFADFSNCLFTLNTMKICRSSTSLVTIPSATKPNEINILLIGETGVGKSTFINAFVNYLAFHSLEEASIKESIVLIPVSFFITIGNQFQEEKIEFGQSDSNEDHNHLGQSVTQHCKSYIFTIRNSIKLRIIDTPGIGDTRGTEQDNINIEHILSYTSNLPHLNAICFLLKPNTTRLHALFRSCFIQLFDFLGPNARENIIFCFTNTRATFYAPGQTAKLLKTMLNELPNDQIPLFAKQNTFCFDSESFRYLAVIKAGHKLAFNDDQKLDFEKSWKISVAESVRLLDHLESRPQYEMNKWRSMKHAQMMITLLIRPMLETIRNALRNLILWDLGNKQRIIELKAQPISLPAWLCTTCSYKIIQIDNISVVTHPIHYNRTSNECVSCHCDLDKYFPVFYELEYQLGDTKGMLFQSDTENMKDRLLYGSHIMTQFLLRVARISKNPFLPWFDLFVREEQEIYRKEASSIFHVKLYHSMSNVKNIYEKRTNEDQFDQDRIILDAIYGYIEEALTYPSISEQMNAIKASQMEMMKNYEHDVSSHYSYIDTFCTRAH
jgi:hypothetical protein